jgi:hypothetical protein
MELWGGVHSYGVSLGGAPVIKYMIIIAGTRVTHWVVRLTDIELCTLQQYAFVGGPPVIITQRTCHQLGMWSAQGPHSTHSVLMMMRGSYKGT